MLVLSRKWSETIQIGDDIRIVVVKVDRSQVRLGIEAPGHISVVRGELLDPDDREPTRRPAVAPMLRKG